MKLRKIAPPPIDPKFQPGDRVQISPAGIRDRIAPTGTTGTVLACGWVVAVQIDGNQHPHAYHPDYWENAKKGEQQYGEEIQHLGRQPAS